MTTIALLFAALASLTHGNGYRLVTRSSLMNKRADVLTDRRLTSTFNEWHVAPDSYTVACTEHTNDHNTRRVR